MQESFICVLKIFIEEYKKELSLNASFNDHIEENISLVFKKENSFSDFYENITKKEKFNYSYCLTKTVETTLAPNQIINTNDKNINSSLA
jgi:hypothetical protein